MPRIKVALAVVLTGVFTGALMAQSISTDLKSGADRPWGQRAPEDYPEIVGIVYENVPGARSDYYNDAPVPRLMRQASWPDNSTFDELPEYVETDEPQDFPVAPFDIQQAEDDEPAVADRADTIVLPDSQMTSASIRVESPPPLG